MKESTKITEENKKEHTEKKIQNNELAIRQYKGYHFWSDVKRPFDNNGLNARDYVVMYLKEKFPNDMVIGQYFEFNKVDVSVVNEKLPVEIQSTVTSSENSSKGVRVSITGFEKSCMCQIDENIRTFGKCWFFFDDELLRYMKTSLMVHSNLKLDWLYNLIKEEKLKVFTLNYKGEIKEKTLEDFNFISKISTTCDLGKDNDIRILDRNKYEILKNLVDYFKISQEEIDILGKEYRKNYKNGQGFAHYMVSLDNQRKVDIGRIFISLGHLDTINNVFDGIIVGNRSSTFASHIGLFESKGNHGGNNCMISFVDLPNVAQYFPAYIRNKEKWDKLKKRWTSSSEFETLIKHDSEDTFLKWVPEVDMDKKPVTTEQTLNKEQCSVNKHEQTTKQEKLEF